LSSSTLIEILKLFQSLFLEFFFQLFVSHQCWFFKITFHTSVEFVKLKFLGFLGSSPSTYSGPILKIKWTFFPIIKSRVLLLSKNYSICLNCQLQMQVLSFFSPYSLSFFPTAVLCFSSMLIFLNYFWYFSWIWQIKVFRPFRFITIHLFRTNTQN